MYRCAPHPVLSITAGLSNTTTLQRRFTTTTVGRRSCHAHENCMHVDQIIIIFYIYFFIFCSLYLLLFLIVLYRTIVTVYTDNMFLYNYLWQMHQIVIIHLTPVGCFTPARGKTVQKNREASGVKDSYYKEINFEHSNVLCLIQFIIDLSEENFSLLMK